MHMWLTSTIRNQYAKELIVVRIVAVLKVLVSKMLIFLRFLEVLEGIERSGTPGCL